jgi:hypothetical protein
LFADDKVQNVTIRILHLLSGFMQTKKRSRGNAFGGSIFEIEEPHLPWLFFYHGLPQPFTDSELQSVLIREISGWFLRKMENTTVD